MPGDPLDRVFPPEESDPAVGEAYMLKGYVVVDGLAVAHSPAEVQAAYRDAFGQAT